MFYIIRKPLQESITEGCSIPVTGAGAPEPCWQDLGQRWLRPDVVGLEEVLEKLPGLTQLLAVN